MKTILLPTLGAVVLILISGCAKDPNESMPETSTTTTTTEENTSSSAMPTPEPQPGTTSTTQTSETHTVAPANGM